LEPEHVADSRPGDGSPPELDLEHGELGEHRGESLLPFEKYLALGRFESRKPRGEPPLPPEEGEQSRDPYFQSCGELRAQTILQNHRHRTGYPRRRYYRPAAVSWSERNDRAALGTFSPKPSCGRPPARARSRPPFPETSRADRVPCESFRRVHELSSFFVSSYSSSRSSSPDSRSP